MWIFIKILLFTTLILPFLNNITICQQIGKSWEFNESSNFEGIILSNSFQDSTVENGYLKGVASGPFPSLSSEPFELESAEYGYIQIRIRIPGASSGKIMWNNDSGEWGFMKFVATGDTNFQVFEIPVYLSDQWVGKITKIMRLDFNPTLGSLVEIDYIRIVRLGAKPTISKFTPIRTIIKQAEEISLMAIVSNDGDIETEISSELVLPDGVTLLSGSLNNQHGKMFKTLKDTLNWTISFDELGEYEIRLKLIDQGNIIEKLISLNVTDQYWYPDKFLLSAWSPPYAWYGPPYDDVIFEEYKNANFNNVLWVRPEDELIEKVRKYDLKYFLLVTNTVGGDKYLRSPEKEIPPIITEEMLLNLDIVIDKYKDDPNMLGYHICDEPYRQAFPNIGKVVERIRRKDPTRLSFVNIWPSGDGYREYIDEFLQVTKLELLSYDRYHFFNGYDGGDYFSNLSIIREYALKYKVPFCNIIQAIGTNGTVESKLNWRTPTQAEHRWLVYSSLTYGVHAIIWFHWHADWGLTGNPGRNIIYPSIQQVNGEIDSLSQIMLRLTTSQVYHSKTKEKNWIIPSDGIIKSVSNNADLILGYFKDDEENDYFMLMNKNYNDSVIAEITLNGISEGLKYFDVIDNQWKIVVSQDISGESVFQVPLSAGDGKLFSLDMLTEIKNSSDNTPIHFKLKQNYPNPFNPVTTISYTIPIPSHVKLDIYNILGEKVSQLVNSEQGAGSYKVIWDASNLSSGLYISKFTTNDYTQTKKMIFLK